MTVDDRALYARVRGCLEAELRLFGSGEGARLALWPCVTASINPRTPDRSLFNAVAATDTTALLDAYPSIRAAYDAAGVRAFTVWVDPGDDARAAALAARGHVLDSSPVAMAAPLDAIAAPEVGDLDWSETDDLDLVGRINDAAYGFPPPAWSGAFTALPGGWHAYVARHDGAPVGCLLCFESADGDCGVSGVATLPAAQGLGVATRLLAVALARARRRGATTTSLQASPKGRPVYARLGYRDLGTMGMWELRRSAG